MKCNLGITRINCDRISGCASCDHYVAEEGEILTFNLNRMKVLQKCLDFKTDIQYNKD